MSQPCRLPAGGRIDRGRPLRFSFDGETLEGYAGDTLASALLANGIHLVGRSFKYHRPRGIVSAGGEEPNALVQLDAEGGRRDPNMRATTTELFDGLRASSQNSWPGRNFDVGAAADLVAPLIPAGFYYKTFMWPAAAWKSLYEPKIRAMAGLGRSPETPDPDRYLHRYAHCDVLVVGAGPAGLAAALAAGRGGARVILADEQPEPGGSLLARVPGDDAPEAWRRSAMEALDGLPNVRVLNRTTVTSHFDHGFLAMLERVTDHLPPNAAGDLPRQRLWHVRARQVVLATGAIERPLVFVGNDRPGIMLADAARSYVNRHAVLPGRRAVVFTNNDSAWHAAFDLAAAGCEIALIADARPNPGEALLDAARQHGIPVRTASVVTATEGRKRVRMAAVAEIDEAGQLRGNLATPVPCDLLLMSGGWNPNVGLFSQSRGKLRFDDDLAAFVPHEPAQATLCAGACNGTMGLEAAIREGARAGAEAARNTGFAADDAPELPAIEPEAPATPLRPLWVVPAERTGPRSRAFVDFQNDVTTKDLGLALREGFTSIEHVKRYTTTGMGTDQGKTSNVNALAIVAGQLGAPIPAVGTTTFRPPYVPLTFGAIVGHERGPLFDVVRRTPIHGWAEKAGAVFENVGNWQRAWYFPQAGETMHEAVQREARAVRETCGLFDGSTLGKIDIQGRDSRTLLNRIYTNAWSKLAPGRCRYGLMLRDDGMVFDDGVTACLADDHFHMTTTTGGAAGVFRWLEEWLQTEWPDLEVYCTSVTEQWATIALNGPDARKVLAAVCSDIDLAPEAFPHMSFREGHVADVPARVFRISFTGEPGYEINVPARHGLHVWEAVFAAGQPFGITPYGTETMHVLRAEKGYIIAGQETDGTTTPFDLGMDWIVSRKKGDFIGRRGLARPDMTAEGRKQLVGLLTDPPGFVLDEGAQIVDDPNQPVPMHMLGHVTSSYMSPNLGRSIALALVKDGRARMGETLHVPQPDGAAIAVRVTSPVFLDPEGKRLDG